MPKKGKANKAKNTNANAQPMSENRESPPEISEKQSDTEPKAQLHERDLQELRSETPNLAGETEQEPTLEQSEPIEERAVEPQIGSNLSPTNVNENTFAEPANTVGTISSEEHSMDGVERKSESPQMSGAGTAEFPMFQDKGDEKNVEKNMEELTDGITGNTHNGNPLNNSEAQENAVNGTAGDTFSDIANNTQDDAPKVTEETTNDTLNPLNVIPSDQHQDTVNHTESTEEEVPTKPSEPVASDLTEPIQQSTEQPMPIEPSEPTNSIEPKVKPEDTLLETTGFVQVPEPAEKVEPIETVDITEDIVPAELAAPSESKRLEPTETTETIESTGLLKPTMEPEVTDTAPAMSMDPTEPAEPTVSAGTAEPAELAEPVGPIQPTPDPICLGSSPGEGIQATTGQTQSSVGSPNFEPCLSSLSHAIPETETDVFEPQPTHPIAQSTEPNAASPNNRSSSVPHADFSTNSTFPAQSAISSVPRTTPSLSKSSSITSATPVQRAYPIESPILRPRSRSFVLQPQQSKSPLRPVRSPSYAQQATILAQKAAPPTPESISPASRASSTAQRAFQPSQRNSGHIPSNFSNPVSRFQISNSPPAQNAAHSTHKESPALKAASPAPRAFSPPPKIGSPLIPPYHSSMVSAHPQLHQQTIHPAPTMYPNTYPHGPGFATALQSPALSAGFLPPYTQSPYANVPPPPQHLSHSHPYGHQHQYSGYSDPNYSNSLRGFQDPSMINGLGIDSKGFDKGLESKENIPPLDGDGEPLQLLQRIQDAIPDMGRVLHGYKSAKGRLLARETEIKQLQAQNEQAVMRKDFYIEALQSQLRKTTQENAEETHQLKSTIKDLRTEMGNIEKKQNDTANTLVESQKSNRQLSQWRSELESHISSLDNDLKEVQEGHEKEVEKLKEDHADILATQKKELDEAFEGIRAEDTRAHNEALTTREKELFDQQESIKSNYDNQMQQMQQAHDALQANFDSKVTELESIRAELSNMKNGLDAKHKELEDTREAHVNKAEAMGNEFNEQQRQWEEHCGDLKMQVSQKSDELTTNERERERLEGVCENKEQQLRQAIEEMNTTMENMDNDRGKLRRILANLGEVTDIKSSKGDTFL